MDTKAIAGEVEGQAVEVVVSEATALVGMRRTRLILEARAANEEDVDRKFLHEHVYPDLLAPVIEQHGFADWPLTFAQFCELPDVMVADWESAVYALNPHWLPGSEKKAPVPPTTSIDD